ncbi:MAG: hypothetical protein J6S67_03555 [Methanobrevibacter sp.]|nr:hypothetical protein [Methanobrevibacter sp.]
MGDFETTVYSGQERTDVWAAACVELYTEEVNIFHSIDEQYQYLLNLNDNIYIYYHNLKFDGAFWIDYLLIKLKYKQAYEKLNEQGTKLRWLTNIEMPKESFRYSISEMGQWYTITIKTKTDKIIEIRDSLKLLPFSLKRIGKSFGTKHQKLDMEYEGFRYPGCEITEEEKSYISNDVLVIKEALEIMMNEGHNSLTIGSCCLTEYKKLKGEKWYNWHLPNLYEQELDEKIYGSSNIGEYIRKSYKGGWCYLAEGKENKVYTKGITADVNSLYPSMMSSESGNKYPTGIPYYWSGNYIPPQALDNQSYFFIRIKTRFFLRDGFLPFIQVKNSMYYKGTECLKTSDILDPNGSGEYVSRYKDHHGEWQDTRLTLTLTMTDYKLLLEHYILKDFEILDGCYFHAEIGIFDEYINKYKELKLNSVGAKRELAKLFLNNLYGKMASNTRSSFKVALIKDDGSIGFYPVYDESKKPGYIPIGSAITSYARNFTIRAAQKNYHGVDNPGFIYADTDSIHCNLDAKDVLGITVHDKNFCCWKLESTWDYGLFVRQKTYIEHVVEENLEPIDKPFYNIKCAGMPEKCKDLFIESVTHNYLSQEYKDSLNDEEKKFISEQRSFDDFKIGLIVPGKLLPKRIKGGILLVDCSYEMRY